MKIKHPEVFEQQAAFCRVLANSKRMMIITLLGRRELSVGELVDATDVRLVTISQHLRVLRSNNIVQCRKEGQTVYYRLTDQRLIQGCSIIRSVLLDDLRKRGMLAREIDEDSIIEDDNSPSGAVDNR